MSKRYGYARVSSKGQQQDGNSLESQEIKLREAGADEIITEVFTGTTTERPKFTELIEKLEPNDTLIVCKLDRFARTVSEGSMLIKDLLSRGVNVYVLNMGLIDKSSSNNLLLNVLLAFAEFERDMIVERLNEGKVVAKANNPNYKEGRKELERPYNFMEIYERVKSGELTAVAACKELGVSRSTWYKWVREVA